MLFLAAVLSASYGYDYVGICTQHHTIAAIYQVENERLEVTYDPCECDKACIGTAGLTSTVYSLLEDLDGDVLNILVTDTDYSTHVMATQWQNGQKVTMKK